MSNLTYATTHVFGNGVDINFNFTIPDQTLGGNYSDLTKYPDDSDARFTQVTIQVNSLPSTGNQSFPYHIHERPVTGDNCTTTGGHHDPHNVKISAGTSYKCDPTNFKTCEVGDLSGKHGALNGTHDIIYIDRLPSIDKLSQYSIVVHDNVEPTKRIACANFQLTAQ